MRIGFTGSHGSGKSTLARLVSENYGVPFIESRAGPIVAKHGFDMLKHNRLDPEYSGYLSHREILASMATSMGSLENFVSDRTPIDTAAYMLADATASAGNKETREAALIYLDDCIRATERMFDIVILVPPGIPFIERVDRAPGSPAYIEHHHLLCRGILFDDDLDVYWDEIQRDTLSIESRMEFVNATIDAWRGDLTRDDIEPLKDAA